MNPVLEIICHGSYDEQLRCAMAVSSAGNTKEMKWLLYKLKAEYRLKIWPFFVKQKQIKVFIYV